MSSVSARLPPADYPFDYLLDELVAAFFERAEADGGGDPAGDRASAASRTEHLGYRVGAALCERLAREAPRLCAELDCVKFVCKDFWHAVFTKQIDNLRTNHQGVYVLQDNRFALVAPYAGGGGDKAATTGTGGGQQYAEPAARRCAFACGLVRGALAALRVTAVCTAAVDQLPAVKFSVHIRS